jgi:hypothetical protein
MFRTDKHPLPKKTYLKNIRINNIKTKNFSIQGCTVYVNIINKVFIDDGEEMG